MPFLNIVSHKTSVDEQLNPLIAIKSYNFQIPPNSFTMEKINCEYNIESNNHKFYSIENGSQHFFSFKKDGKEAFFNFYQHKQTVNSIPSLKKI